MLGLNQALSKFRTLTLMTITTIQLRMFDEGLQAVIISAVFVSFGSNHHRCWQEFCQLTHCFIDHIAPVFNIGLVQLDNQAKIVLAFVYAQSLLIQNPQFLNTCIIKSMSAIANLSKRVLGKAYHFPSTKVADLVARKKQILDAVSEHGCICIKNVDYPEKEMTQFSKGIWKEVLELPKEFCLGNVSPEYNAITRVGNILPDGSLKSTEKESLIWHQDGSFWGYDKKHIYNCLHTRVPSLKGGETMFMDLIQATEYVKQKMPELYNKLRTLIGYVNVEEIGDFKKYGARFSEGLGIKSVTLHRIIDIDPKTGKEILYMASQKIVDPVTHQEVGLKFRDIFDVLHKELGFYSHKWEKGDLLIWDNLQVLHRAAGPYEGNRLLWRTQGRNPY